MGNVSICKINFEDIQNKIEKENDFILISTLSEDLQNCLIYKTVQSNKEIEVINSLLKNDKKKHIIIYGKNSYDMLVLKKYKQLIQLGFENISIYTGGLFEWLLLQDIYGDDMFKTTNNVIDILKYK